MKIDVDYLRDYYASLADEGLLAIDRSDLVDVAQQIYNEELSRRGLSSEQKGRPQNTRKAVSDEAPEIDEEPAHDGEKPAWLENAAEVYSMVVRPGQSQTDEIAGACDVLKAAGIPCYADLSESSEDRSAPQTDYRWRVMVPGKMNLRATGILERDLFNPDFETEWKAHLEELSDQDLRLMNPPFAFCGLFDKIERVERAYDEELARRNLKA